MPGFSQSFYSPFMSPDGVWVPFYGCLLLPYLGFKRPLKFGNNIDLAVLTLSDENKT